MAKTKLVATVGPASESEDVLGRLIDAGVDVFRLNFSHGSREGHADVVERIREVAAGRGATVAILGDLCGPKIRLGQIAGGQCTLYTGRQVRFQREQIDGTPECLWSGYAALIDDVSQGHRVLIDDGNVSLRVVSKEPDALVCEIEVGGPISDHKGINLPDSKVTAPALTKKDLADLDWAVEHDLDWLALSFVRSPADVSKLRTLLDGKESTIHIVSKIEKPEALDHLDEIIELSDGVMVARGDLGVEMDLARVPIVQKEIALRCQQEGRPVIIATQMLQSMVEHATPTRAEVSDVANAILDRADAVMLSAETSIGQYPVQAVEYMRRIADQTESFDRRHGDELGINRAVTLSVATAVLRGVSVVVEELKPVLVAIWTEEGKTPVLLSKYRLDVPVVTLAPDDQLCRQLALSYGLVPVHLKAAGGFHAMLGELDRVVLERGLAVRGDRIVVAADTRPDVPGETDALFIHLVGSVEPIREAFTPG